MASVYEHAENIYNKAGLRMMVCPSCGHSGRACGLCGSHGLVPLHPLSPASHYVPGSLTPSPSLPGHINHIPFATPSDMAHTLALDPASLEAGFAPSVGPAARVRLHPIHPAPAYVPGQAVPEPLATPASDHFPFPGIRQAMLHILHLEPPAPTLEEPALDEPALALSVH